jgi:hypothetical protein
MKLWCNNVRNGCPVLCGLMLQVEVTKQLLCQQLQAKCAEAAAFQEQIEVLHAELAAAKQWHTGTPSAGSSSHTTPTGMAPAEAGVNGVPAKAQKKPSFAARLKMSFAKHGAPGVAGNQVSPTGETPQTSVSGNGAAVAVAAAANGLQLAASEGGGSVAGSEVPSLPAYPSISSAAGSLPRDFSSGQLMLPSEASLFKVAPGPSLTGSDERLATATKAQPAVQELVQHYEAVAGMERTSSCSNSICSLQSEPGPTRPVLRPTPLPRVATLSRNSPTALSPKSPSAPSKLPASPNTGSVPPSPSGAARSAFGRTVPAGTLSTGSFTSRIPSVQSPALSIEGSGASTPNKTGSTTAGADMAAVSRRLRAGDKPSAAAVAGPRAAGSIGGLTRTASSSSNKSEAASAGGAEGLSLRKQLSRLVPGSSNGSAASERTAGGSGGGSMQGSIFKAKTAGSNKGGGAAGKKAGAEPGPARKAK